MARGKHMAMMVLALATAACAPSAEKGTGGVVNETDTVAAMPEVEAANVAVDNGMTGTATIAANASADATANAAAEADDAKMAAAAADAAKKAEEAAKKKAEEEKAKIVVAAVVAPPPATFGRCAVCHDATKGGPNKLGPNLYGIYGKSAGVHAGFGYSDALKGAGLKWDDATLDKWMENPRALVPGNMMSFPGLKDPAKRQEIIAYLKSLK